MYIIDNKGEQQEITHLGEAIEQADMFCDMANESGNEERKAYWQDVYNKLIDLRGAQTI